jgi:DNA-binding NarL/FixJ family response regulator
LSPVEESTSAAASLALPQVRVAILDKRRLIAEALAALIRTMDGFVVIDVLDDAAELPAIIAREPGVLLVGTGADLSVGFNLIRSMRQITLDLEIVILADALSPELVRFALDHRLNGLILTEAC